MKKIIAPLIVAGITLMTALPTMAQRKPLSPHDTVSGVIDGNRITITYGRPYTIKPGTTEVRKIWGGLVPYDKPWRMGANEATTLITQKPIEIAGKTIPAGAYTLYMMPSESGASHLVFSSALGGWGEPVDTQHDVAQVELTKEALDQPVDQFTMAVAKASSGGTLQLMWEKTKYSVAFTVQK
ncbi:MAG TPA: DUF2911 domain-containing protein [Dongiaceae bacterium]|nr:DUF2911 domain-containing protein [Dongiaceae bacterium]